MLEVVMDEAKRYVNDSRPEFEGPRWDYGCYWVYVVYNNTLVGVVMFDEDLKRLPDSTPRSLMLKKIQELTIDIQ